MDLHPPNLSIAVFVRVTELLLNCFTGASIEEESKGVTMIVFGFTF